MIGTVVATRCYEGLEGVKLLLAEPLDDALQVVGGPFVIADVGQAGIGDVVSWVGGREAALALVETFVPVDAAIVTIIDQVDSRPLPAGGGQA